MQTTATELYANSQGMICEGDVICHWCGAHCQRRYLHDDPPPIPFVRSRSSARFPSNPYICKGCWLFRRKRLTVWNLGGEFKDGQCPINHSWWITSCESLVIDDNCRVGLYEYLLRPPLKFALSLIDGEKIENLLHFCPVNDHEKILGDTPLLFHLNNIQHAYTVYELTEALKHGTEGKEPGVRALIALLGPYTLAREAPPEDGSSEGKGGKKGRGRPREEDGRINRKLVREG